MIQYNSLHDIKKDFEINSDDLEVIKNHINDIRINTHPDKTNGEFPNENTKERYHNANSAIEYLNNIKNNQSLVVIEKITDLMRVVTELIPSTKQTSLEQNLDAKISFAVTTYRSKMFIPKISLTAASAITTFIYLFPNQIKDNPLFSTYIDTSSPLFASSWFMLVTYSAIFWIMTFLNEEKAKQQLMFLKVDSIQNQIFEHFIDENINKSKFSKDDLTSFIYRKNRQRNIRGSNPLQLLSDILSRLFSSGMITMEIAQNISELIISRGEKNKVIEKLPSNTLSDIYKLINYN